MPGQYEYTVGNPVGGTFAATTVAGSGIITGTIPPGVIVGGDLSDVYGYVPGATVLGVTATTVTMSSAALVSGVTQVTYTTPGNIKMPRPLRFRDGFTRSVASSSANNDYTFTFTDLDTYKRQLLKNQQGPWPIVAAYQPTFPLGTLYVYPAPGSSYVGHLFSDLVLTTFASSTTPYSLPQGYTRALKKLLALELAPIYGKTPSPELRRSANEAKALIRGTNDTPVALLRYDSAIQGHSHADAGFIIHGGF
jgi:hypothetical protein